MMDMILMINDILAASIRIATPITLAALGGILCQKAGIFNIALEGMMLVGAFAVICGIKLSGGNVWIGLIFAMFAGGMFSLIFAFTVIKLKANQIISGIAINLLALGLTSFLLNAIFKTSGSLRPDVINKIMPIKLMAIKGVPIIGGIFAEQNVITYISFAFIIITSLLLYKTSFGLSVSAVGELPSAATTAGVNPNKIYLLVIIWSGVLCGLGGAYISSVMVSEFTENMIQGRGFTAFTALVFGGSNPLLTWIVSILFGFADALGIRIELSSLDFPSSILKMFPYILSVCALALSSYLRTKRLQRSK
jgi:simple sugar transport system permease protein